MKDYEECYRNVYNPNRLYYPCVKKKSGKVCYIKPLDYELKDYTNYQIFYTPDGEPINFGTYTELETWVDENIPLEKLDSDDYPVLTQKAYFK